MHHLLAVHTNVVCVSLNVALVRVGGHCCVLRGWRGHGHLFWHSWFVYLLIVVWHLVLLRLCLPAAFSLSLMCHVGFNQKILLSLKFFFLDLMTRQKTQGTISVRLLKVWFGISDDGSKFSFIIENSTPTVSLGSQPQEEEGFVVTDLIFFS